MARVTRVVPWVIAAAAVAADAPAQAQSNLDAGKSAAQIFADTCNACHRGPREIRPTSGGEMASRLAQFTARQPPGTLPFQPPEHMIFRAGGLTIKLGDEVIGSIGAAGAPGAKLDDSCAHTGLDKIRERLK